jgi:two-component system sensor histidine kinase DctS
MGMGLNICRSIVEHHRGRLWFEAVADGDGPEAAPAGTRFLFTLPVHAQVPDRLPDQPAPDHTAPDHTAPDHTAEAAE